MGDFTALVENLALLADSLKAEKRAHKINIAALGDIARPCLSAASGSRVQ